MDNLSGQGVLGRIFSHRYVFGAMVAILAFSVTGTNLYANTAGDRAGYPDDHHNLVMQMIAGVEYDLLLEDTDYDPAVDRDSGYLDGQAVGVRDALSGLDQAAGIPDAEESEGGGLWPEEVSIHALRYLPDGQESTVSVPTRTRVTEYVVQSGDSAGAIADRFGLTAKTVLESNGLTARSVLRVGQTLRIPPMDGILHKVAAGDSLGKIASRYKADAEEIAEANGISPDSLTVGLELVIPNGQLPPPPAPPKPVVPPKPAASYSPSPEAASSETKLLWPAGVRRISQYYSKSHTGLDIAGPMRTPLYAAESGTVIFSGWNSGGYGNMVLLDHGGGLYTRYAHATQLLVKTGDQVERGETIALMGSTGRSTGPHIHFEVGVGSIYNRVNPLNYIQ